MKSYGTIMECRKCGEKICTKWHNNKVTWWIERKLIKYKHLKNKHNMSYIKTLFRNVKKGDK